MNVEVIGDDLAQEGFPGVGIMVQGMDSGWDQVGHGG
jgi:hypothetical protein